MSKSNAMSVVLKNNAQLLKKRRREKTWSIVPKSKKTTTAYDFPVVGKFGAIYISVSEDITPPPSSRHAQPPNRNHHEAACFPQDLAKT